MGEDLNNIPLEKVDINYINSLKREGKYYIAEKLLISFRKICKKQWNQDFKEINSVLCKVERRKSKKKGVCTYINCNNKSLNGKNRCKKHYGK